MHSSCLHFAFSKYTEYSSIAKCRQEGTSALSFLHPNYGGVHSGGSLGELDPVRLFK